MAEEKRLDKKWGIGEGKQPFTSDPENPEKFFMSIEEKEVTQEEIDRERKNYIYGKK